MSEPSQNEGMVAKYQRLEENYNIVKDQYHRTEQELARMRSIADEQQRRIRELEQDVSNLAATLRAVTGKMP